MQQDNGAVSLMEIGTTGQYREVKPEAFAEDVIKQVVGVDERSREKCCNGSFRAPSQRIYG